MRDTMKVMKPDGAILNRKVAWTGMAIGAGLGMLLGLWSFDGPFPVPGFLGEYDETARRLMRLGHIAFFGLGFINLLLAHELGALPERTRRLAGAAMNVGNLGLPLTLVVASIVAPVKYLMAIPASAVLLALVLVAHGVRHDHA
ncbi:MAG: hypothetical protein ACYTHK_16980 [Planctomycetota bacterium]|jgi:hypothetical protein